MLLVTRKETEILIRQSDDRTGQKYLFIRAGLFQGRGQRQQRLSGTGLSGQPHQLDIRIVQHLESETLLGITGLDTKVRAFIHLLDLIRKRIVASQYTITYAFQDKAFVRVELRLDIQRICVHAFRRAVDLVDQIGVYILIGLLRTLENIYIHDLIRDIILNGNTQRTSLHTKVHILADQGCLDLRILLGDRQRTRQNTVIWRFIRKRMRYFLLVLITGHDIECTFSRS